MPQYVHSNQAINYTKQPIDFQACLDNSSLTIKFCYNLGKCIFKVVHLEQDTKTVAYCLCRKGFGGESCREDNRFLEANANIPIVFLVGVSIFIILSIIVALKCLPNNKKQDDKNLIQQPLTLPSKIYYLF